MVRSHEQYGIAQERSDFRASPYFSCVFRLLAERISATFQEQLELTPESKYELAQSRAGYPLAHSLAHSASPTVPHSLAHSASRTVTN